MLWVAQFPPSGPGGWQRHDQEALCWKNCWAQQAGRQTYNVMPLPVNFADWSVVVWPVGLQSSLSIFIVYCVLQVQDSDSKSSHYYAEVCCTQWIFMQCCSDFYMYTLIPTQCRALHKQLNHNSVLRMKLAQDLQVATDAIQQLQVCQYHDIYVILSGIRGSIFIWQKKKSDPSHFGIS